MSLDPKSPAAEKMNRSAAHWRVMHAAEDLLAACEADAAYLDHRDRCNDCADAVHGNGWEAHCEVGQALREQADALRGAALLKAKGDTPMTFRTVVLPTDTEICNENPLVGLLELHLAWIPLQITIYGGWSGFAAEGGGVHTFSSRREAITFLQERQTPA